MSTSHLDVQPPQVLALEAVADVPVRPRLQIGEWCVDPATNELGRGSKVVRIEPKAMDVLALLAQRVGQVVSREELFAAVWPGVVVGDEALTQSIIKLRRALGDNSRSPTYIETISKRGYRLIAPVRQCEGRQTNRSNVPIAHSTAPRHRSSRTAQWVAALAVVVVAILATAAYHLHPFALAPIASEPVDASASQPDWLTVTVVPFDSLGPDPEQAYLARGISENLITDLSRLSGLRVIRESGVVPTSASARYRIAGSVQRDAELLRINIYLAETKTNQQLWSTRFDRPFSDLFSVQDEINARLTELLPAKVSDVDRQQLAKRYTKSLEAYDCFLRAQALFLVRRSEDNDAARALYRKALELDPTFARAYAGLAMTYAMDYRLGAFSDATPTLDRALQLAEAARLIDPDIPEVYWALGFVHAQSRRHEQAIDALQHAIELNRSFADAYAFLGGIHTYIGQPDKSIPLLRTAMRLNTGGGYLYFLLLGRAYLFENDVEQALINLRAALMRNPVDVETRVYVVAALAAAGDVSAAKWEVDEIRALQPRFSMRDWLETYPMTDARQKERLARLVHIAQF